MWLQGGRTALHMACENGHVEVVHALIAQYGAKFDARIWVSYDVTLLAMRYYYCGKQRFRYDLGISAWSSCG